MVRRFPSARGIAGGSLGLLTILGIVSCSANSLPESTVQISQNVTLPQSATVVVPPAVVFEDVASIRPAEATPPAPAPVSTPAPLPPPPRKEPAPSTSIRPEVTTPSRPAPVVPAAPATPPPVALPTNTIIRNADLVRLTRDGVSESDIVVVLKSNRLDLDTSIAALVELKNAGVSDRIINAMLASAKTAPPAVLRNADVVRMTRSGQNDAAVIAAIRSSRTEFDVSTNGLVALKRDGVSDAVIDAVLAAAKKR